MGFTKCFSNLLARKNRLIFANFQKLRENRSSRECSEKKKNRHNFSISQKLFFLSLRFAGQVFSQNLRNRLDLASSEAGPDTEDNSYLGYSLALGDFTGNGGGLDVAVGMPRAANLTGKVRKILGRDVSLIDWDATSLWSNEPFKKWAKGWQRL